MEVGQTIFLDSEQLIIISLPSPPQLIWKLSTISWQCIFCSKHIKVSINIYEFLSTTRLPDVCPVSALLSPHCLLIIICSKEEIWPQAGDLDKSASAQPRPLLYFKCSLEYVNSALCCPQCSAYCCLCTRWSQAAGHWRLHLEPEVGLDNNVLWASEQRL